MTDLNLWEKQWRTEMISKARSERDRILISYTAMKNKNTEYARSMLMVLEIRQQVLNLLQSSPVKLPCDAMEDNK